jgi:cold shock CspA family protein
VTDMRIARLPGCLSQLREGHRVSFEEEPGTRSGRVRAVNVAIL